MKISPRSTEFKKRHIGPNDEEVSDMLQKIKCSSLDTLIQETVPESIRMEGTLRIPLAMTEQAYLESIRSIAERNDIFKSYIGLGYYNTITPSVILRMIFENPGWYTQYTPYQAEISQGRLEALLNFQTMIIDLTGMEVANASLLDEATAAAEAMTMLYRLRNRDKIKNNANRFVVSNDVFPQTIDVLMTRSEPLGIDLHITKIADYTFNEKDFGVLLQYPNQYGNVWDYTSIISKAHDAGLLTAVAADIMSLVLLKSPGEMGVDVILGSSQRFGVPMGFGGPHAAFFATRESYKRQIPGRIIGVSQDRYGNTGYRMALQTREQHIRREKATSNICTAQALLAILAGMYAVYHGPEGLRSIAEEIHDLTALLNQELSNRGFHQKNTYYFDTLLISGSILLSKKIQKSALKDRMNFRYFENGDIGISIDETTTEADILSIIRMFDQFADALGSVNGVSKNNIKTLQEDMLRHDNILAHPVFNKYHSETDMMRYIKKLENRDLSLTSSMIPLGSCTMKLNPASAMFPVSWPAFSAIHPFVPLDQVQGYQDLIAELEEYLNELTGLQATSLQPNSGAQGEFAGLMVIRAYQESIGEFHRNITLIPSSAHGTNPASAIMAGMKVVIVKCKVNGDVDLDDLREKVEKYKENLAALMITYPSTHGVFEEGIIEMCRIIHDNGGQVYMDGANMNAQVGLTNPGLIGADVCHLNLHKTFSIPHGGGGPGVGPICVAAHLASFLPGHRIVKLGREKAISAVAATPWGSASILLISYAYVKMLGRDGLKDATCHAILNANYIKSILESYFPVLFNGKNGHIAHELIFDLRIFKESAGIDAEDVAKRLMDYSFHAPTMSWPVAGTIMVEPTESESKDELDSFCEAMISIYHEIKEIENGTADRENNVLKNAPHTALEIAGSEWSHPYSREKAVYPIEYLRDMKFWPVVGRIDNTYGDRNLMCSCPLPEDYLED